MWNKWVCNAIAIVVFAIIALSGASLRAKEPYSLRVIAPSQVYPGQQFQVTFRANGKSSEFRQPVWGQIQVLAGPSMSTSRSVQITNGSVMQSETYMYSFVCRINSPGTYTIPAASVVIDGERLESSPYTLEVLQTDAEGGADESSSAGNASNPRSSRQTASGGVNPSKDFFVVVQLSRNEVYQGEPILATLRLYTRLDIVGFDDVRLPDFKGFWTKELETPNQINLQRVTHNGREYNMGVIKKYVLFPQKSGELQIDPMRIEVQYRVRAESQSFWDEFMGSNYRAAQAVAESPRQTVKVKPLPQGKPALFTGGVGNFTVKASVDQTEVSANEPITYKLIITGKGNLQLLQKPELNLPNSVEVFEPKVNENVALRDDGQSGSITYEYVMIPRAPGQLQLPSYEMAYFDPVAKAYRSVTTEAFTLTVRADSVQSVARVTTTVSKEDVKYLGEDIRHIFLGTPSYMMVGYSFVGGLLWWVLVLVLVVLFAASFVLLRQREKLLGNVALAKGRRAGGIVRKRLRRAKALLEANDPSFYNELLRATWGYLSDKLSIETADLSADTVRTRLAELQVPESNTQAVYELLRDSEYAQYAPQESSVSKEELYRRASETISELEKWLNSRK